MTSQVDKATAAIPAGTTTPPRPTIVDVAGSGACVGCGACAFATQSRISTAVNSHGHFQVDLSRANRDDLASGSLVCPFADEAADENRLASEFLPPTPSHDSRIGHYLSVTAGRVLKEDVTLGSSGGLTSWMTLELLKRGMIDGVVHVGGGDPGKSLFEYCVSHTADEVAQRRKSQYYSTTIVDALQSIRGNGKRYAFVGVPCFVKAVRLLARQDTLLREQLAFCIGLVCGHLKSSGFAELLAWQAGVPPTELMRVDFRVKDPNKPSNDYSFSAWGKNAEQPRTRPVQSLVGGNWGHAMFQLKACDYCDDIFAETADIAFGDAWLPQYKAEWRGTNVVVNRHPVLESILQEGAASGSIVLEPLSAARAAASQDGNYRHRWDGLSVRLADDRAAGRWSPHKRIVAGSRSVSAARQRIVRLRRQLGETSHAAFQSAKAANSLDPFLSAVRPLMAAMAQEYKSLYGPRPYVLLRKWVGDALRRVGLRG
ncbi:Coenzyme F420 hydrogenase/dehydrogenase, beta subunit C-terminal domain [Piscinibacter sp.]|uniref:Coenzyme F420 hydrogenase/dehydrogenase, beta subunit C-terminal domain n=1 Tax=Piscinibacter sp. TaxID=1903157 RepID=UPI002C46ACF8|nr:Coenzyme F420 hydrogenase/dehydrogenase, beta subunit C-terminal domain [Albitalea sp.]HUG23778.1 Coenzyme F420 hydrogenase/dehydrogenase, beta subunit C-terminal domain [Albitalea sp.]